MADSSFPFQRLKTPIRLPARLVPTRIDVNDFDLRRSGSTTVMVVNPFPIWTRVQGTTNAGADVAEALEEGVLVGPGWCMVLSTQYPKWLAAIAVEFPGFPVVDDLGAELYPQAYVELSYGAGL